MGKVFVFQDEKITVPRYELTLDNIEDDLIRFDEAVKNAINDIEDIKKNRISAESDETKILDAHIMMLQDPMFLNQVTSAVKDKKQNVEWSILQVVEELVEKLNASQDEYIMERSMDLNDVSKRVVNHLMQRDSFSLADLEEEVILVTHNLLPSEIINMNKKMVKGIAMDVGGKTSHTAILARSFEIPAVVGLGNISRLLKSGDDIIIDGRRGLVIPHPDKFTCDKYQKELMIQQKRDVDLLSLNKLSAETHDGKLILMKANIEIPEEVDSVLVHGADGIGLFRSEFLLMQSGRLASENDQYKVYSQVLSRMNNKPVTIRTLDIGGDKIIPDFDNSEEKNPLLGWRAVRFCLDRREVFKVQLRALLKASVHGNLRIMFPMISGVEELNQVLEVLEEVKDELTAKGIPFHPDIPIGIMIEIPSAALTSDILARRVNFFSIGTNDLIQYAIAIDRGNEKIAHMYEPFHPAVLRLIKMSIDNAHRQGLSVGMCGEMAGDPMSSVILLGLGLDEFSLSAFGIPLIKKMIRTVSLSEAEELTGNILEMRSYRDIENFIRKWMEDRFHEFLF